MFLQFLVKIPSCDICLFWMAYRCKPINHDSDERCQMATGELQACEKTVELFKSDQKVKPSGLWAELSTSMVFVVGALEVISSRPIMNFLMMRKGDPRRREPCGSPDNN
jgi:hypothetical protein